MTGTRITPLEQTRAWRLFLGDTPGHSLIKGIAAPGDMDGDGFDDLAISTWDLTGERHIVLYGSSRGLRTETSSRGPEDTMSRTLVAASPANGRARVWGVTDQHGSASLDQITRMDIRHLAVDCDDNRAAVNASAWDRPGDGLDSDCDGYDTCWFDADGDCRRSMENLVTPDISGGCTGPRELPADAPMDDDDHTPALPMGVAALAMWPAPERCLVRSH